MDIFHSGEKRDDACLHERKEMRWNVGRVSNTVTNAENKINRYAKGVREVQKDSIATAGLSPPAFCRVVER
jgi:hypothetical protein